MRIKIRNVRRNRVRDVGGILLALAIVVVVVFDFFIVVDAAAVVDDFCFLEFVSCLSLFLSV